MERPDSVPADSSSATLPKSEAQRSRAYGGVGTWRWDATTRELAIEPETEQLYGVAPGTIRTFRDWADRLAPEDVQRFESERDIAVAARRPFRIEFRIQHHPSGEQRWILTRGCGEYDQSGKLLRLLGVDIDITEQKRTELHFKFINRMQVAMMDIRDEEALIRPLLAELGTHLGVTLAVHVNANPDGQSVTIRHTYGDRTPSVQGIHQFADYGTPEARAQLFTGNEIVINDVAADPRTTAFVDNYRRFDVAAFIVGPFVTIAGLRGGLAVCASAPREWRQDEVQVVRDLVARLFPALEQARTEAKLRENDARLSAILERLPVAVGVTDADGRFQLSNELMRRFVPDTLPARDPARVTRWRAVDAEGRPVPPEQWPGQRALRGESVTEGVEFVYTDDVGRAHWFLVWAIPFRGDGEDGLRAIVVGEDIDERKHAEAALRESEERFRVMADDSPIMIWVTNAAGTVQFVNRAFSDFFGTTLEAIEKRGWQPLIHPGDYPAYSAAFAEALRERKPFRAQARWRRADGEWRWVDLHARPRYSSAGEFLGFAGSSPDVTDRRQAEAALREADRRKGEFLATLAHELRNPLAPIRNAVQIMKLKAGDDPILAMTRDMIDRQVTHMVRLIDDLLDVNRITRGKLELRKETIDLRAVLAHTLEAYARQIEEAGQALTVSTPSEPILLEGDRARLAQILANLLDNACKYTDRGGTIRVTVERGHGQVRLSVKDTGIGIPPDKLEQIFELFAQVDRSLERAKPGLGIGLALVRQLVEMHGGTVRAFSEGPGRGSEFVVALPIPPDQSRAVPQAVPATHVPAGARHRIVIADDNVDNAGSLATLLELSGNETWVAHDGLEAVDAVEQHRPDTVLLDIGMPKLNGYEVCRRIRGQPWGEKMTLIAVTGWGQQEDREKSKDVGFDYHLVKPIDQVALMRLLAARNAGESRP